MALTFRGTTLPGLHGDMRFGQWGGQVSRTNYNNVKGTSEQRGERMGRTINFESWWYNGYSTCALLEAAIEAVEKDCPINGSLVQTGTISRTLTRCTLEAIEKKQLIPLTVSSIGWIYIVEFHFFQLSP